MLDPFCSRRKSRRLYGGIVRTIKSSEAKKNLLLPLHYDIHHELAKVLHLSDTLTF